ncbi:exosortase family protein XrtF [Polaribacter sp. MSW13]|uniref:Exosortase family protein XrtF n=1 Tax=Polaribacter marinus TaxID=2916838 RepID=A0A9X2AMP8_9FLAO|nr:exosortase family protein XrtF [Polaribacter marinus]
MFAIYAVYLQNSQEKENGFQTASITTKVAEHTVDFLEMIGYYADSIQHDKELSVKLLIENQYTARVIEGCNSISIIILFISFIVAFAGSIKATILFSFFGSLFIYIINVLRIAFLTIMLYKYPDQQELLHNLVFPAIIYGAVFLLWVIWVNKFSNYKK